MIIPFGNRAEVSIQKLRDYCLNPLHDEGKNKARVFASALGMTAADAYGQRYSVDLEVEWRGRRAIIRSGWILEHGSEVPRLTSCYVL
ncbi:MAG: DUF6883 domain-containing protein [Acidobacteriota bacterium]